jgi:hypothetical protein
VEQILAAFGQQIRRRRNPKRIEAALHGSLPVQLSAARGAAVQMLLHPIFFLAG